MLFRDRKDAGEKLAQKLLGFSDSKDTIILALPRGGVVVAKEVSLALNLPLDIVVPRKIGAPYNPELAIGAICEDEIFLNDDLVSMLAVDESYLKNTIEAEKKEAQRRKVLYRKGKKAPVLKNMNIILIDDGIATGATIIASIKYLKTKKPKRLIVAVPVAPVETVSQVSQMCDEVLSLYTPTNFFAIGQFYDDFAQTTDSEVIELLN